jgi:hypothetical protein
MSTAAKAEVFRKMNTEGNLLLRSGRPVRGSPTAADLCDGEAKSKVEVDRQHDGVTPAARESTGVPASAVR